MKSDLNIGENSNILLNIKYDAPFYTVLTVTYHTKLPFKCLYNAYFMPLSYLLTSI